MAVGESKERETGENIAQGLIDGGIVSSNNLSKGIDDFFFSSQEEHHHISLRLLPRIYQDDLFRFLKNSLSAQLGNDCFENLMDSVS